MDHTKKLTLLLIGWGIFGVLIYFFIRELPSIYEVLKQAKLHWLILAITAQLGTYWSGALVLGNLFKFFDHRLDFKTLFKGSFMISYLNQSLPSWGVTGIAFLIFDLKHKQVPAAKSMTVGVMFYALSLFTFFILLVFSLIDLFYKQQLSSLYVWASAGAIIFVIVISLVFVFSFFNKRKFKRILEVILKPVDKILSRFSANNDSQNGETARSVLKVDVLSHELQETFRALPRAGKFMWAAFGFSMLIHFFDLLSIYFLFLAFNFTAPIGVLIGGFTLASVFGFISLIPSAIGVFESSMSLVYAALGMPFSISLLVSLAFRSLAFWLPLPIGIWIYKHIFQTALRKNKELTSQKLN